MAPVVNEAMYQSAFLTSLQASRLVDRNHEFSIPLPTEEAYLGYDVRIDFEKVGIPVLLQFKVADGTTDVRKNSIHKKLNRDTTKLNHSMVLRKKNNFLQHQLLMRLDRKKSPSVVYYSTPNYETKEEYQAAAKINNMQYKSTFLSPREIGAISTKKAHEINYFIDYNNALLYPEKSIIRTYTFDDIISRINEKLKVYNNPLRVNIDKMLKQMIGKEYERVLKELKHILQEKRQQSRIESSPDDGSISLHFTTSVNVDTIVREDDHEFNYFKLLFLQFFSRTIIETEVVICCLKNREG